MTDNGATSKLVTLGASALLAGGLGYFLYKKYKQAVVIDLADVSPEQMVELLEQLIMSQSQMKEVMKTLATEIYEKDMDFPQICKAVERAKTEDPLQPYGLTIEDFSQLLAMHNGSENIRKLILKLTSGPDPEAAEYKKKLRKLTQKYVVEDMIIIHTYMLEQLKLVLENRDKTVSVNSRVATIATQAFVGKVVRQKYELSTEDLEMLTAHYHTALRADGRFFELGTEMRLLVQLMVTGE